MPRAAAEHRANITLTTTARTGERIERIARELGSSKNAVVLGVLLNMTDQEIADHYRAAVQKGLVVPRGRIASEQRELLELASKLGHEKLRELLDAASQVIDRRDRSEP